MVVDGQEAAVVDGQEVAMLDGQEVAVVDGREVAMVVDGPEVAMAVDGPEVAAAVDGREAAGGRKTNALPYARYRWRMRRKCLWSAHSAASISVATSTATVRQPVVTENVTVAAHLAANRHTWPVRSYDVSSATKRTEARVGFGSGRARPPSPLPVFRTRFLAATTSFSITIVSSCGSHGHRNVDSAVTVDGGCKPSRWASGVATGILLRWQRHLPIPVDFCGGGGGGVGSGGGGVGSGGCVSSYNTFWRNTRRAEFGGRRPLDKIMSQGPSNASSTQWPRTVAPDSADRNTPGPVDRIF